MTIEFMVLGGPRSATTWLANLLTTDHTLCLHDPFLEHTTAQVDRMSFPGKRLGVADTSALLWTEWLTHHPAKKIIIWRDVENINRSLCALGLVQLDEKKHVERIEKLKGLKVYQAHTVFKPAIAWDICRFFDVPFCRYRFEELRKMNIQPQFSRLPVGKEAAQALVRRLAEELNDKS